MTRDLQLISPAPWNASGVPLNIVFDWYDEFGGINSATVAGWYFVYNHDAITGRGGVTFGESFSALRDEQLRNYYARLPHLYGDETSDTFVNETHKQINKPSGTVLQFADVKLLDIGGYSFEAGGFASKVHHVGFVLFANLDGPVGQAQPIELDKQRFFPESNDCTSVYLIMRPEVSGTIALRHMQKPHFAYRESVTAPDTAWSYNSEL